LRTGPEEEQAAALDALLNATKGADGTADLRILVALHSERYKTDVLSLVGAGKNQKFKASLAWLVKSGAITQAQADRLDDIYDHRHDLTHELMKYIVDPDFEPDVDLFGDALQILAAIRRYWTQIEIEIGTFDDRPDVTVDDVVPGTLLVLQMCIEAYAAGLPDAEERPEQPGGEDTG
jgi:hypothetical protein